LRRPRKLARLLRTSLYRQALRSGVAATVEHRTVHFPDEYATVIDIGAHHGQFALFARERFPQARIVSFEPLNEALTTLERTRQLVGNMRIVGAAASDTNGEAEFVVSRETDSSSLRSILPAYTRAFPGTDVAGTCLVRTVTLDAVLETEQLDRPCLLKIDAQGGEIDVLAGAAKTLQGVDGVLVECSFVEFYAGQALIADVVCYLNERAFSIEGVSSLVRDRAGRCLQADLLFARRRN
jgi:FkbM family methyltransferase